MTKVCDLDVLRAAKEASNMREAARKCGLSYTAFISRAKRLNVYKPNPTRSGTDKTKEREIKRRRKILPLEEIFAGMHPTYSRSSLKKRILSEKILPDQCNVCGEAESDIVRILDHINGINNDHRIENLRFLCPNCNSKQATFAGRNRKKQPTSKILDEELIDWFLQGLNTRDALKKCGYNTSGENYRRFNRLRELVEYVTNRVVEGNMVYLASSNLADCQFESDTAQ